MVVYFWIQDNFFHAVFCIPENTAQAFATMLHHDRKATNLDVFQLKNSPPNISRFRQMMDRWTEKSSLNTIYKWFAIMFFWFPCFGCSWWPRQNYILYINTLWFVLVENSILNYDHHICTLYTLWPHPGWPHTEKQKNSSGSFEEEMDPGLNTPSFELFFFSQGVTMPIIYRSVD